MSLTPPAAVADASNARWDRSFFGHPRGLSTLFFTEMWERFSYYGMRALLILFMTETAAKGGLAFPVSKAGAIYGLYTSMVFLLSVPGGWLADRIIGARNAVLWGGMIIALGHFLMAIPSLSTFYLGLVAIRQGDWPAAVTAFRKVAAAPDTGAAPAHNLAYALERLGRTAEAEAALTEAVARGGGADPYVLTSRAALALHRRDLESATRDLAAARPLWGRKTPSPAWYHYAAIAAILSGDLDRAAALLTEGVAQHPRAVALHSNLAAVQERQGHLTDAAATWERALELEPENATFQRQLDAARHVPTGPGADV